jgi:hypothetical protein
VFWKDTPENYARLLRTTHKDAKKANLNMNISLGSVYFGSESSRPGLGDTYSGFYFLEKVFNHRFSDGKTIKDFIDLVDIHPYGNHEEFSKKVKAFKNFMAKHQLNLPIWASELGVSSTSSSGIEDLEGHAQEVLKIYVTGLSLGVKKMFWSGFKDFKPQGDPSATPFTYMGFSYYDGTRKPAFYTYKLMTTILEGSDWRNTEVLSENKNGVFIYRFLKKESGKEVFVGWWNSSDSSAEKVVQLMGIKAKQVRVTTAVTLKTENNNIEDVRGLFDTKMVDIVNGSADVTLGKYPVFVEVE